MPSSYVYLNDPSRLDFEYMQWMGHVLETVAPSGKPIAAAHIGGAGCSLPLYLAATWPGSRQNVFEIDRALVTLAREAFGLRGVAGLRLRTMDGRAGLATMPAASCDVVIRDAFDGSAVPRHLTTTDYHHEVAAVLKPGGVYLANVADTTQVRESRLEAAAALTAFGNVVLIAEPGQLRGRRYGNVVLAASHAPLSQDVLTRKLAGGAVRARYVPHERVVELTAGVHPPQDSIARSP